MNGCLGIKIRVLGIDVHGVLDHESDNKKIMLELITKKTGIKIYVISGPPISHIINELNSMGFVNGVHYHRVFSIVDYLKNKNTKMWTDDKDRWWADYESWWSSKANICNELKVDLMIDDSTEYAPYFDKINTKFLLYSEKGKGD
jgi:hypothetical protein